ncbi:MAG: quinone-dependent dihydroorotate dehydrogenase [Oceanicaulis sp.]|uniref:quinone-dependent dihydroorotate dehydrogenase n=1 Tax=Glycocaulis sp. TaxID=1969725 RepID=UPI0025BB131D|nr:quinone-dependent dihydroorotate dehydrogenase [Glycocaulis sp.]MCC5982182.1 quinone-dependent dihydroorotate dehydrogenase [Oceanicaulis sp.]MCH8520393.1 quinone-dependent dihydroorotate dehydrogenase [Glycocaulis sp.]
MALADMGAKALTLLPAETAHQASLAALKAGLGPKLSGKADPVLATSVAGIELAHPVGLAAGYDKNGEAPDALLAAGFAFVELGAVTPRPQAGNPQPRLFRLREDRAVINRMGFNNEGLDALKTRLEARAGKPGVVGINLGANKDSEDRAGDYVTLVKALKGLASFFTVNISSPNTPGLRDMQGAAALNDLLKRVNDARWTEPVFLKVAPDLDEAGIEAIVRAALDNRMSGLIVSNTTLARPDTLKSRHRGEAGGLSGAPLTDMSNTVLRRFRQLAGADLPLIGVGGINSMDSAYARIRSGASALQLYTALVYEGPGLVGRLRDGLAARLKADGYASLADAVGVDA